jgi:hypothetical protein
VRHVDPEAVHSSVHPEAQHVVEHLHDLGVVPVQVGLLDVEDVQIPLPRRTVCLAHPLPAATAEDGVPVVGRLVAVRALAVAEHVAIPLGAARTGGQRRLEPLVLIGGVVGHQVDQHPQAELVCGADQLVGVVEGAEDRVDLPVVGHVIPRVGHRRHIERADPDRVDAQIPQVGQPGSDAGQVTDAVGVGVGPGAGIDLVDHGVPPPGGRGGCRG